MRALSRVVFLGALPTLLGACVRVATTPLGTGATLPPVPPDSVRIFATQAPPAYTEIALLRTKRLFGLESDRRTLRALRERAARLGANGILLLNTRGAVSTHTDIGGVILGRRGGIFSGQAETDVDEVQRAVAIRYTPVTTASQPK